MPDQEYCQKLLKNWEYGYCPRCRQLKEKTEIEVAVKGLRCIRCGSYDLESPGWVNCPHQKAYAVKCPRGGRGITMGDEGCRCIDRCRFRSGK